MAGLLQGSLFKPSGSLFNAFSMANTNLANAASRGASLSATSAQVGLGQEKNALNAFINQQAVEIAQEKERRRRYENDRQFGENRRQFDRTQDDTMYRFDNIGANNQLSADTSIYNTSVSQQGQTDREKMRQGFQSSEFDKRQGITDTQRKEQEAKVKAANKAYSAYQKGDRSPETIDAMAGAFSSSAFAEATKDEGGTSSTTETEKQKKALEIQKIQDKIKGKQAQLDVYKKDPEANKTKITSLEAEIADLNSGIIIENPDSWNPYSNYGVGRAGILSGE